MIKAIKLLGFKSWLWWEWQNLTYKFKQRRYRKAIEVIDEVLERKLDQVTGEPEEHWQEQAEGLRQAIESIEEDIPYLNPNY